MDKNKVELLANELIEELGTEVKKPCHHIDLWVMDKKRLLVDYYEGDKTETVRCKYTGK